MARHFAALSTSIWDDPDFCNLTSEAQRMYLMLMSQAAINSVGLVPMAMNRWAHGTKGMTQKTLTKALQELEDALFVVVDWKRDELLVRSFVRNDGGYENSLRRKAIQREARLVGSAMLAGVLAHELNRLNVPHEIAVSPIDVRDKGHRSPIEGASKGQGSNTVKQVGTGTLEGNPFPEPGTGSTEASASRRPHRIPDQFFITDKMRAWATGEVPDLDLTWYTKQFVDHWRSATRNATKLDWIRAWQKWMRDEYVKPNHKRINGHGPPSRHDENAAVVERMRQMEAEQHNPFLQIEA